MSKSLTLSDIKKINSDKGFNWFDQKTMKFWGDTMKSFKIIDRQSDCIIFQRIKANKCGMINERYSFNIENGRVQSAGIAFVY